MKIRFTSTRSAPDIDQGIKVPYAPPKRHAFRLRWYLILLLASSPLLYVFWGILSSWWLIEAPAYIELPVYSITAPQSAQVSAVHVQEYQHVQKGQPLLELRRAELDARAQTLRQLITSPSRPAHPSLATEEKQLVLLRESMERYQRLFNEGAATKGELDAIKLRLLEAETLRAKAALPSMDPRARDWQIELDEIEALRRNLTVYAPSDATVLRVETLAQHNVLAGQPLLTLQQNIEPRVIALLSPRHADYAHTGQQAWVSWSSGEKIEARVLYNGTVSERIPEMLRGFDNQSQGILVQLKLLGPLPEHLKVNNVAVNVRFPRDVGF